MRIIILAAIGLLFSCESKKDKNINRQYAVKREMSGVNIFYYKKLDSLGNIKTVDTNSLKQLEVANEIRSIDATRISKLLKLQNEYDSLEAGLE